MPNYYVNKNTTNPGNHNEVHKDGCAWMPEVRNRIYLGYFLTCREAVKEAEKHYPNNTDGCKHCSEDCHHG